MEEFCAVHPNESAVGKCADCRKPHCLDCLDMETGKVLCPTCKAKTEGAPAAAEPATPVQSASVQPPPVAPKTSSSPFDFKKGLDEDPLGLMNAPVAPKVTPAPKPQIPMPSFPAPNISGPSKPLFPMGDIPAAPSKSTGSELGGGMSSPVRPFTDLPPGSAPPLSYPLGSLSGIPVEKPKQGAKAYYLIKAWSKYLVKRAYVVFDPLAKVLRIPTYLAIGVVAAAIVGLVLGLGMFFHASPVKLVKVLAPLHLVKVGSGQITDLDVTSYMDLQAQVQNIGFTPLTQLTVTQLPSTNFFDVWIKEDVGTYGEILKFPNQITPRVAFVTVFTNGTWMATDSWQGGKNHMTFLDSECFPNTPADQLYVKHVQKVEKMKKEGLQVALMGENRYMVALTDHLRWFMATKGLPAYKVEFAAWH